MAGSPALRIVRQSKPATPPARRVERGGIPPNGPPSVGPLPFTMTDAEIARDLRVSPKTIRRMDEAGKIPAPVTLGLGHCVGSGRRLWIGWPRVVRTVKRLRHSGKGATHDPPPPRSVVEESRRCGMSGTVAAGPGLRKQPQVKTGPARI